MKKILFGLALTFCFLQTTAIFAWGTTGHRVIAEIAERNLNKKAKKELQKIIGKQQLAYWANWPDFIKSDPTWKFADSWHYLNLPGNLSRAAFDQELADSTDENLYKRALVLMEELKSNSLTLEEKQQKLYFLIHIIGDAHQPLHIGRSEDLGGNRIKVEWFRKPTNLHSLWDSALVDFDKYSYTEYATVLDIHGKEHNKSLVSGSLEDWIYDSYTSANAIYNSVEESENLSYRYHFDFKDTVEEQLLKGGLRLAKLLNELYK
ncbi:MULTISPECIES: S1/P1 nuclease [unclassified Myroides]|uniref:S1/P1 nuclease n=1 Tax=unclassified Myroides TaxID=2642485 RepID=UPI0015FE6834|nr:MULTISPECIES: S1/P1 nuclease [unclassified Myroides]MBB1149179.1 S1/P1 nuclease [Myroides sp. NP-2]MDM1406060.1 S1/P1 nuclease [Myroides sp. DF42-4-2]